MSHCRAPVSPGAPPPHWCWSLCLNRDHLHLPHPFLRIDISRVPNLPHTDVDLSISPHIESDPRTVWSPKPAEPPSTIMASLQLDLRELSGPFRDHRVFWRLADSMSPGAEANHFRRDILELALSLEPMLDRERDYHPHRPMPISTPGSYASSSQTEPLPTPRQLTPRPCSDSHHPLLDIYIHIHALALRISPVRAVYIRYQHPMLGVSVPIITFPPIDMVETPAPVHGRINRSGHNNQGPTAIPATIIANGSRTFASGLDHLQLITQWKRTPLKFQVYSKPTPTEHRYIGYVRIRYPARPSTKRLPAREGNSGTGDLPGYANLRSRKEMAFHSYPVIGCTVGPDGQRQTLVVGQLTLGLKITESDPIPSTPSLPISIVNSGGTLTRLAPSNGDVSPPSSTDCEISAASQYTRVLTDHLARVVELEQAYQTTLGQYTGYETTDQMTRGTISANERRIRDCRM
ncbi:hypothetical protein H4R33_001747 [Dimargaris cristalligena]|nr:hypothetical protein H4R33_001747 [Dimargaris cristalligena]